MDGAVKKRRSAVRYISFAAYCALMLVLLFWRSPYDETQPYWELIAHNHNAVPLATIRHQIGLFLTGRPLYVRFAVVNLVGNVVMFVPLGFMLPWVFPALRRLWKTLLTTAAVIAAVELIQLFTLRGHGDVDDLILNTVGAAIGYGVWRLSAGRTLKKNAAGNS